MNFVFYECGICGHYHPWEWNGDCREDPDRISDPDKYADEHGIWVIVRSWIDRIEADAAAE
jgi:hypothetical protein